jgi:hypothetical protein
MFFDGQHLYLSTYAIESYLSHTSFTVLPPIKNSRIFKFGQRGFPIEETDMVIQMDKEYGQVLDRLESLHQAITVYPSLVYKASKVASLTTYTNIRDAIQGMTALATQCWKPSRLDRLKWSHIKTDLDILDQAYRLDEIDKDLLVKYIHCLVLQDSDVSNKKFVALPCRNGIKTTALWMCRVSAALEETGPISYPPNGDPFVVMGSLCAYFNCSLDWPPQKDHELLLTDSGKNMVFYLILDVTRRALIPYIFEFRN